MVYKNNIDPVQKRYWPGTKVILTQYKSDTDPVQERYWPDTKAILTRHKSDTVWYRFWYLYTMCLYRQYWNPLQVWYWYTVPERVPERCARRVSKGTVSVSCTVYNDTEPVPLTTVEQYRNGYWMIPECLLGNKCILISQERTYRQSKLQLTSQERIYPLIMDVHNWIMDTHNSIIDMHNHFLIVMI